MRQNLLPPSPILLFISYILFFSDSFLSGLFTLMVVKTTASVINPPKTTEGTRPINLAATPDSKAPNSFDDPINMLFTDATRPRISSGVYSWRMVPRITTLTLSNAPLSINSRPDKMKLVESPNPIIHRPNPITQMKSTFPVSLIGGRNMRTKAIRVAPIAGQALSKPRP